MPSERKKFKKFKEERQRLAKPTSPSKRDVTIEELQEAGHPDAVACPLLGTGIFVDGEYYVSSKRARRAVGL